MKTKIQRRMTAKSKHYIFCLLNMQITNEMKSDSLFNNKNIGKSKTYLIYVKLKKNTFVLI